MRICEIFRSEQGEGLLTGIDSLFVRTSGCNLRCGFCDTPFASWRPEGEQLSVDDVVLLLHDLDDVDRPVGHVVLTGGEPMLWPELVELTERLREEGRHITIETAGTIDRPVACDLMSISPKLSDSDPVAEHVGRWLDTHRRRRLAEEVIRRLTTDYVYQLKFVVSRPEQLAEIEAWLARFPKIARDRVQLMPEARTAARHAEVESWLRPLADEHGYRYCPREHVRRHDGERGK